MDAIGQTLVTFWESTGIANFSYQNGIMIIAALFFLYLIPFPFVPVLIYGALMFIAPYILRIPNVYPSGLYRMAGLLTPKVGANVAYTRFRLSAPFFEFIATVLIYLFVSVLLSILVFHFKKRKEV